MIKKLKPNMMDLNNMTLETKRGLYLQFFSSGSNSEQSFGIKIEVITLLCFLTQELNKRHPEEFKTAFDVLSKYVFKDQNAFASECGWVSYMEGLSIICDDLLFGVSELEKPENYSSASEVKNRIKEIIAEWLPF